MTVLLKAYEVDRRTQQRLRAFTLNSNSNNNKNGNNKNTEEEEVPLVLLRDKLLPNLYETLLKCRVNDAFENITINVPKQRLGNNIINNNSNFNNNDNNNKNSYKADDENSVCLSLDIMKVTRVRHTLLPQWDNTLAAQINPELTDIRQLETQILGAIAQRETQQNSETFETCVCHALLHCSRVSMLPEALIASETRRRYLQVSSPTDRVYLLCDRGFA